MTPPEISGITTTAMAFIGDAAYEVYVRQMILNKGQVNADKMHAMSVKYVRAEGQAKALKAIYNELSEKEADIVKRARNRRSKSKPKNADPYDYKLATAFEALFGYLYLTQQTPRMEEVFNLAVAAIEEA